MSYCDWRREVDAILVGAVGLDMDSLVGDQLTRDAYEAGDSPDEFVREVVVRAMRDEWGAEYARLVQSALKQRRRRGT